MFFRKYGSTKVRKYFRSVYFRPEVRKYLYFRTVIVLPEVLYLSVYSCTVHITVYLRRYFRTRTVRVPRCNSITYEYDFQLSTYLALGARLLSSDFCPRTGLTCPRRPYRVFNH